MKIFLFCIAFVVVAIMAGPYAVFQAIAMTWIISVAFSKAKDDQR